MKDEEKTKKEVIIIVNGAPKECPKDDISYEEVVKMAFPNYSQQKVYSVTYKRGMGNKPEGILPPDGTVKIKEGMIFNVSETTQS
jgi:CRISPR/Cas system endoribonuclease Cas6 (RAMP superfamily)